jgi:flagellar protein FlaG
MGMSVSMNMTPEQRIATGQDGAKGRPESASVQVVSSIGKSVRQPPPKLEKVSLSFNRKLQYVVDRESHDVTVKVIDPETDKVIKVLPPEELQRINKKLGETLGNLVDEKM